MKDKCKHCDEVDCQKHCQDSLDGKHEPDPKSLSVAEGSNSKDIYLDINCGRCGRSGTAFFTSREISW